MAPVAEGFEVVTVGVLVLLGVSVWLLGALTIASLELGIIARTVIEIRMLSHIHLRIR